MPSCKQPLIALRIKKEKEWKMKPNICLLCSAKNLPLKHNCRKESKCEGQQAAEASLPRRGESVLWLKDKELCVRSLSFCSTPRVLKCRTCARSFPRQLPPCCVFHVSGGLSLCTVSGLGEVLSRISFLWQGAATR